MEGQMPTKPSQMSWKKTFVQIRSTLRTLRGFMRVCEGLIIKWQKAHYEEGYRGKRKDTEADSDKSKRPRAGSSSVIVKAGEYCEGCGKPRHKRETCQLTGHPDYNEKGQRI